jgi:DNA-damage-inducible protein J
LYPIRGTLPQTTEVTMNKSAMIRARVDPNLKEEVEDVFEQLGLSATQAITLFYQQVKLNRGLPFDVRIPNADTLRTFAETDADENIVPCENAQDLFARLGI